jgi:hypothetical protein
MAGGRNRALELLRSEAIRSRAGTRLMAKSDIDLISLRSEPEFQAWITEQEELPGPVTLASKAKSAATLDG